LAQDIFAQALISAGNTSPVHSRLVSQYLQGEFTWNPGGSMGFRTIAILASAIIMQGMLLVGTAEVDDANQTDTNAASPSAHGAKQQLRGTNTSLTGIPFDCPESCTYYFFGCGTLGNPPLCLDGPHEGRKGCCRKE